jgi:hypothetical protein
MNELDDELTARGLDTRIVFICYHDTTWAPEKITLKNPKRFSLLVAAISRDYTESVDPELDYSSVKLVPYELNSGKYPASVNEYLAHADNWKKPCPVPSFVYEYHFWRPYFRDTGIFNLSRMIYDDVKGYRANGCNGIVQDGSQRAFFPNGFAFYVYASTLFDCSLTFDELVEDYFSTAYGEDWREVVSFFEKLGGEDKFRYIQGKLSVDTEKSNYYNPAFAPVLRELAKIADDFAPFVEAHKNMPMRAQTVAYKLMRLYMEYVIGLSKCLIPKAYGAGDEAKAMFLEFLRDFGRHEVAIERYFDQHMMGYAYSAKVFNRKELAVPTVEGNN